MEPNEWKGDLPEEVAEWDEFKNAETPEAFWNQMTNHRRFLGQSIRIPGEDASAEDRQAFNKRLMEKVPDLMPRPNLDDEEAAANFYNSIGRPETHDGYEFKPEGFDDDGDKEAFDTFSKIMHKHGLNQRQFKGIMGDLQKIGEDDKTASAQAIQAAQEELKKEWGADMDSRLKVIQNVAEKTGAPEAFVNMIKEKRINKDAAVWLYNLGVQLAGEGTGIIGDNSGDSLGLSPDEAKMQISEIRNNKEHPYWHKSDPGHKAARAKVTKLYQIVSSAK